MKLFRYWRVAHPLASAITAIVALSTSSVVHAELRLSFPQPVTPIAHETLHIHNVFMWVITIMFLVVFAIMVYSFMHHRKREGYKPDDSTAPKSKMQWFWTMVPFAILLFIDYIVFGIPAYHAVLSYEDSRSNAQMVIKVTGYQWKWQYEYPHEGIKFISTLATPREQIDGKIAKGENYLLEVDKPLVIPVNKKIRVVTTSADVIHSWWVPAFGVKRDSIPGVLREFWMEVDTPGRYTGQCAELCGKDHAFMPIVVHALPEIEYQAWLTKTKEEMALADSGADREWKMEELMIKGKDVYQKTCMACHQAEGQGLPPAFPALAGAAIAKAPMLTADGKIIKGSHLDVVMYGRANTAMQAFSASLNDVDIAAVITYERNAWGNNTGDILQPSVIKGLRQ
jgi:cytochrome c oxidase subunit 2